MNRYEEYKQLLAELDTPVPAIAQTLTRAKTRYARQRWIVRPAAVLATVFGLFILLVNFCTPVALACSRVPLLRELAEAVTFSRSLTDAVDNAYVQQIDLQQIDNSVKAKVEYLIVDQKQVNVFFRLDSVTYSDLSVLAGARCSDGSPAACSILSGLTLPDEQLQCVTLDYTDGTVPDSLILTLDISGDGAAQTADPFTPPVSLEEALLADFSGSTPVYIAHFDFLLKFDPAFTAAGKTISIDQTVELDGQRITLTDMEIYPTHLRLNVADNPGNTAWLKRLDFRIETGRGMTFDTVSNGITATGSQDSPMMVSYRADSTYFYDAKHLKVVITGAEWLDKEMKTVHVDLVSGTAERMPDGAVLADIKRRGDDWIIAVQAVEREKHAFYEIFVSTYYDADGKEYSFNGWSSSPGYGDIEEAEGFFFEVFALKDFPYDEVWLTPSYSHEWTAPEPVTVIVQ